MLGLKPEAVVDLPSTWSPLPSAHDATRVWPTMPHSPSSFHCAFLNHGTFFSLWDNARNFSMKTLGFGCANPSLELWEHDTQHQIPFTSFRQLILNLQQIIYS